MKTFRFLALAIAISFSSPGDVCGRAVVPWTDQELFDKSDLVVIATVSIPTTDTKERISFPGFPGQKATGVETKFAISAVLKGDESRKELTLHHYRGVDSPNGPSLVSFNASDKVTFLLFLVREADGRFAPTFGQKDPGICGISIVKRLYE